MGDQLGQWVESHRPADHQVPEALEVLQTGIQVFNLEFEHRAGEAYSKGGGCPEKVEDVLGAQVVGHCREAQVV
eukprot:scaffold9574_cov35-Tisochrysis_lutea.AAC.2